MSAATEPWHRWVLCYKCSENKTFVESYKYAILVSDAVAMPRIYDRSLACREHVGQQRWMCGTRRIQFITMVPRTFHLQERCRCKDRFLVLDGLVPLDLFLVFLVLDRHFPNVDRCHDEVMLLRVCSFYNKKKWDCSQLHSLEPFILLQKTPFLNTSGSAFKDSVNDLAAKQRFGPEGSSQNVTSWKLNIYHIHVVFYRACQ